MTFGSAYHEFRDVFQQQLKLSVPADKAFELAWIEAEKEFVDPELGSYYEYLDKGRLLKSCLLAKEQVLREIAVNQLEVTRTEDAFDLETGFFICENCGWVTDDTSDPCQCHEPDSTPVYIPLRSRGIIDQFAKWQGSQRMVRDFKTTSRMGSSYRDRYDPNQQMLTYSWAASRLSGRPFEGVIIETLYNTKTKGPELYSDPFFYTPGQITQWLYSFVMYQQLIWTCFHNLPRLGYLAFPQNTNACNDYGKRCPYIDACKADSGFMLENELKHSFAYVPPEDEKK